jgi:hypothetical protein
MEINTRSGICVCVVAVVSLLLASCAVPDQEKQQVRNSNLFLNETVPITVTVTVTEVEGSLDNVGNSDFFAAVHINGEKKGFGPIDEDDHIRPNWIATVDVPVALGKVPVTIDIFDSDGGLNFEDDHADVDPGRDLTLNLVIDVATGRWSGDQQWPKDCSSGNGGGDGNARVCWTVTIPNVDFDGDGLLDAWEVNGLDADGDGTVDVDLPAMGADPTHKDLFLELDWMTGQTFPRQGILDMKAAFAAAPINAGGFPNPDDQVGINLHVDVGTLTDPTAAEGSGGPGSCGDGSDNDHNGATDATDPACLVGDNLPGASTAVGLGGGNELPGTNLPSQVDDPAFYALKRSKFNPNRAAVFRYGIIAQPPVDGLGKAILSGGQAEIGGNDLVEFNHDGGTLMHELGHTLNLHHGGEVDANCKPNYVSVMNYDLQFGIPQNGGGAILDYSPPRFAGGRGVVPLITLDENNLDESLVLDGTDVSNRFVFVASGGGKTQRPLNGAADWNADGTPPSASGLPVNIDTSDSVSGGSSNCTNNVLSTNLTGHDDWANVALSFRQFGDSADGAINPVPELEPTRDQLVQQRRDINTTDLSLRLSATPDPVAAGEQLVLTAVVDNIGGNSVESYRIELTVPAGLSLQTSSVPCAASGGVLGCDLGFLEHHSTRTLVLTMLVDPALVYNHGGPLTLTTSARVRNLAGGDESPSNDQASTTTQVVAKADLAITGQSAASALPSDLVIGEPVTVMVRTNFTNLGPSAPIDAIITQTATASEGATITPASSSSTEIAVGRGEARSRDTAFSVTCVQPGAHSFSVLAEIVPTNPADVDPNTANNRGLLSFSVECVVPVAVNIKPGGTPNPINLGSQGVTPLAVLTTVGGEYGLPLSFDATAIDLSSVRFGERTQVFSETGGAAEAHGQGHLEDSFEKDERTRDGDIDMVLHFSTSQTGLTATDTEGCVKGRFTSSGQSFKFFGCDSIVIRP